MRTYYHVLYILLLLIPHFLLIASPTNTTENIKIDQFGYLPNVQKIAIISNPIQGYNAIANFSPAPNYEIRRWNDDAIVFSGAITTWNGGATHSQSGDQVWWFDFSSLTTEGSYYIYDSFNDVGSFRFEINENVYVDVIKAALRTYYYQRCNMEKALPYAEVGWTDSNNFVGTQQDSDCRLVDNPIASTSKDLTGGWFDAGDYNKYINYADGVIHDLLFAYQENPNVWGDDYNIPESNNNIPDILDEVKYELDWFLKMQLPNGSVLHKISATTFGSNSPPSTDTEIRRYAPATPSATISACGAFAHAAMVFKTLGNANMQTYAQTLENAAINAWNWLQANPTLYTYNNAGFVNSGSVDQIDRQQENWLSAAVYLFALTEDITYRNYFDANYASQLHLVTWTFAYPFEDEYQDAALFYTTLNNATPTVSNTILNAYQSSMLNTEANMPSINNNADAYRAFLLDGHHVWGSNGIKSVKGLMFYNMATYNIDAGNKQQYIDISADYLHYLHGVNPLSWVYLSNMNGLGAEKSINEFYHAWFTDGSLLWDRVGTSTYGPPPGFLVGGVNPSFAPDGACNCTLEPPQNQPIQKSYHDWNTNWPQNSWEITENSITYQSAYIKLLSKNLPEVRTKVKAKAMLEGAFDISNNNMKTTLRTNNLLPTMQPFNTLPWNYTGTESVASINQLPTNMVDWVLLEVRDVNDNFIVVAQKAALLLNDGSIVDVAYSFDNNIDGVYFYNLEKNTNYFISIKHRNHLAVMSQQSVNLPNDIIIDFTEAAQVLDGENQLSVLIDGLYGLSAGDFNAGGIVTVADFNIYRSELAGTALYQNSDCSFDGNNTINDYNLYKNNSSKIGLMQIRY